jgi:hypothetical protein
VFVFSSTTTWVSARLEIVQSKQDARFGSDDLDDCRSFGLGAFMQWRWVMEFLHSERPCHGATCVHVQGSRSALKDAPKSFLVELVIATVAFTAFAINSRLVSWLSSSLRAR